MKLQTIFTRNARIVVLLVLMILVSACDAAPENLTPAETLPVLVETAANPAAAETVPASGDEHSTPRVTVDVTPVAQKSTSLLVAAVPPSPEAPWWKAMPEHTLLTLQGYPVSDHLLTPQIFVFPVEGLDVNVVAGKVAEGLQALLQDHQMGQSLPYLPPYNAAQVLHAQVKYLDFATGQGVRFLTQYDQGLVPVNNRQLLYTFQGLTSDGKYYLAAVLPVNLAGLPAAENVTDSLPVDFFDNFPHYLEDTVEMLDQQAASAYTPDLSQLDAMIQSIEIK